MKKDNSFKQAARWVARLFGYKAENKFARGLWYVFATAASVVTLIIAIALIDLLVGGIKDICNTRKYQRMVNNPTYLHEYRNRYVSPYVIYHDGYPGYLYNTTLAHRTAIGIQWICKSSDGDSLAVFCTNDEHKRGYFNRFTGEVVVPAQYEKAWIFSEGVACVLENGMLKYIDHEGKVVIDKCFPYANYIDDYCFHHGLCLMSDDYGHIGLIDRIGEWKVEPNYSFIGYEPKGFWLIQDLNGRQGLLRADGEPFMPIEYESITVRNTNVISVLTQDHLDQLYDFEGNLINVCDYREVMMMEYTTDEYDEYGNLKEATAHCLKYRSSDYHYGLMDRSGNVVTLPLYDRITAIGLNLYLCEGDEGAVILNGNGKECGLKL